MIEITYCKYRMEFTGHAGYEESGKDIVCAGVSALYVALIEELTELEEQGAGKGEWEESGLVWFEPEKGKETQVSAVFETVWKGLCGIARDHSRYVSLHRTFLPGQGG